jgi:DNA-binding NarL/FixJ family response regulator
VWSENGGGLHRVETFDGQTGAPLPEAAAGSSAKTVQGEEEMKPCRIILADDHTRVRQGIKRILGENPDLEIVGEAADGVEVLKLLEQEDADMVILDIQMPRMNGIIAARRIKERYPGVKILILTMHKEDEYLHQVREIGVEGLVLKEDLDLVLLGAIKALQLGKTFFSSRLPA